MDYIAFKYNKNDWNYIKDTLKFKYNITPENLGTWDIFQYICYDRKCNILTNYSTIFTISTDVLICTTATEFIYKIGMLFNMKKEFTKADLKSGMVVKLNNNQYYLVVDNVLVGIDGQILLKDYNDNLEFVCSSRCDYDLNKVYQKKYRTWRRGFNVELSNNLELIWERKERKETQEYTMQEIADKLGIPVRQLRIKK